MAKLRNFLLTLGISTDSDHCRLIISDLMQPINSDSCQFQVFAGKGEEVKRENNFELVRERVLERAADAAGDASAAAFDKLVGEKLKPNFDVFALASEAAEADRGCTGMPRSVTRAAFLHALCAKLDLSAEGFEKKLLQAWLPDGYS